MFIASLIFVSCNKEEDENFNIANKSKNEKVLNNHNNNNITFSYDILDLIHPEISEEEANYVINNYAQKGIEELRVYGYTNEDLSEMLEISYEEASQLSSENILDYNREVVQGVFYAARTHNVFLDVGEEGY